MAIQFLAPARATDLIGVGRVLRRGKRCQLRRRRRHPGRRSGGEGDRHLQGGLSQLLGVMTARPWILPSCRRW